MSHKIIALGRQFGSGGHEVGQALAKRLSIPCYDKELITLAALHSNLHYSVFEDYDEHTAAPWVYELAYNQNQNRPEGGSISEVLFHLQQGIICSIAQQEDAVIVGRCADEILRENKEVSLLTVFIAAPFEYRVLRKMNQLNLSRRATERLVRRTDTQRSAYYQHYTGKLWGDPSRFDLYLDTSLLPQEDLLEEIISAYQNLK